MCRLLCGTVATVVQRSEDFAFWLRDSSIKERKGTKTARFQPTHLQRYGMFHSVVYLVLHMYDTTYYGEITMGTSIIVK